MSEEFNEGMNENRGMAEEHKGPEENPSITETPGSVNFTMKEAAEEKTTEQEQTAPGYGNAEAASGTPVYGNTDTASGAAEAGDSQQPAGGQQRAEEPAPAPTPENPVYARSYKSESGKEEWYEKERKKNYDSYKFTSPIPPENNKKKSPEIQGGIGKKLGTAAACAAVFGLVAGVVFQATNYVGDKVNPKENVKSKKYPDNRRHIRKGK